jgi:hypothetical protein
MDGDFKPYYLNQEEVEVLRDLVETGKMLNEQAMEQVTVDRSIDNIDDFNTATQDQRHTIEVLAGLEVKFNDG